MRHRLLLLLVLWFVTLEAQRIVLRNPNDPDNAPRITTTTLDGGTASVAYNETLDLQAGVGRLPLTFSITSGALPTGVSINSSTGALTGTPTVAGTYNFTIRVVDALGGTHEQKLSILIAAGGGGTTISASDITLDGVFRLQQTLPDGSDGIYAASIAIRIVAGTPRLAVLASGGNVVEVAIPALKAVGASGSTTYYNPTTSIQNLGRALDTFQDNCEGTQWESNMGILWDETQARYYATYGADYPQGYSGTCYLEGNGDPFFGYGVLNGAAIDGVGAWKLNGLRYQGLYSGFFEIPSAWRASMGGANNRLALWGGGYGSLICADRDASAGPAAVSFNPSDLPTTQAAAISFQRLIGHWDAYCDGSVSRRSIPTLAFTRENLFEGASYDNLYSFFDATFGVLMVDNGTKSGLLTFEIYFAGTGMYVRSNLQRDATDTYLRIYDLDDVAAAVTAGTGYDDLTPVESVRWSLPEKSYYVNSGSVGAFAMGPMPYVTCSSVTGTIGTRDATATCAGHGFGVGTTCPSDCKAIHITGAANADYNTVYTVDAVTSSSVLDLTRGDSAAGGSNFTNASAGGSPKFNLMVSGNPPGTAFEVQGSYNLVAHDATNRKIYILYKMGPQDFDGYQALVARYSY